MMTDIKMKGLITMTNSKMTYVSALSYVLDNCNLPTDVAEKLVALHDQQVKRNSAERKPTAKQIADKQARAELGEKVLDILRNSASPLVTVAEICAALGGEYSTQKISAVLKSLGTAVEREVDKRKAYYRIAG